MMITPQLAASRNRVWAQYLLETDQDPARVAATMAGEQSTGTFTTLPYETAELTARCGAIVERLEIIADDAGESRSASLPVHGKQGGAVRRAIVELSWSLDNFGPSLPNLMATVAGNLFELRDVTGLRLLDIAVPTAFAAHYPGPQFGCSGTRKLAGVANGPLIGTIIKPSVGLSPRQTAEIVQSLCDGGIDFIKDDELQANGPHCPFDERVSAVMRVINAHAERTGKKVMFAFNITADLDDMLRQHDLVRQHGGTCVMVSLNSVGLAAVHHLRKHATLPIHGHRNGWGYLSRHPALGFEYTAWHKFWRLAGVDHMHVNGLRNKFSESDASAIRSAQACLSPMFAAPTPGYEIMPVFSSGQWAQQAFDTYRALGSTDLIYASGGGIAAHPGGIRAGVESIRHAWEAAEQGLTLEQAAAHSPQLQQALEHFRS
ncbi:MAG: ribulose-bisphosphate carboxylase large subunit family protein [Oxalobacteraceae bacterium]|nr:ribulose-bisphosphate carboxylase large subunit family protein [Oxalobacteraceae bacterium]